MDWTKAKTILIAALLITNVVLIAFMVSSSRPDGNDEEIMQANIAYLADRGITISAEIPESHQRMASLSVRYGKTDAEAVKKLLEKEYRLETENPLDEEIWALADTAVREAGLMSDTVKQDRIQELDDGWDVRYRNVIDGIPIEKSYISCKIQGREITGLEWYWLEPMEFGPAKKRIISVAEALMRLYGEWKKEAEALNSGAGITAEAVDADSPKENPKLLAEKEKAMHLPVNITEIEVVYWLNPEGINTCEPLSRDTAYPSWKFTYQEEGGEPQVKYVEALGF